MNAVTSFHVLSALLCAIDLLGRASGRASFPWSRWEECLLSMDGVALLSEEVFELDLAACYLAP